jgi:predicted PurR-regulated permease PerM
MIRSTATRSLRSDITFAFALALACYLAWLLRDVLILLYVSALFAVVLRPMVQFISQWRIGQWRPFKNSAIFFLLFLVVGGLIVFASLALPPVIRDVQQFGKEAPFRLPGFLYKLKHIPFASEVNTDDLSEKIQNFVGQGATYILISLKNWASAVFTIIMGLILTVYFTLEGDVAYRWMLSFLPLDSRERLDRTLMRAQARMGRWLLGQGSLMLILGVASTAVFLSLHVRYGFALGVLTGLLNIVPVLGAAACIALALMAAAVDSWGRVIGVGVFYLIYLQIENSYLTPRIMKSSVDLPGLAILVALLVGSALAGVLGALVSAPTAALVAVLLDEYLVVKDAEQPA